MFADIPTGTYATPTQWYIVTDINVQRINRANGYTEYIAGEGSNDKYSSVYEIELNALRSGKVKKVQ